MPPRKWADLRGSRRVRGALDLERRIERAAEELESPAHLRRSWIDIALGWGFSSPSHFSRSFRRRFGASPSEFRARAVRES